MLKGVFHKVAALFGQHRPLGDDFFEELEEALVSSDVSVHSAVALTDFLRRETAQLQITDADAARDLLKTRLVEILTKSESYLKPPAAKPGLYLMVGVNGTGKTTTIAKLAHRMKQQGKQVLLAAGDTFRAAAAEQLQVWGERLEVPVVRGRAGGDPAAVIFDSLQAATARGIDLVIADTAGRLHTKSNLMQELHKIGRVAQEKLGRTPDELLLVVDATTGQNALSQAREFQQAVGLSGLILSKMDSTAKGGIVITIADEMGLPIKCIGTGERPEDLADFDAKIFVDDILGNSVE